MATKESKRVMNLREKNYEQTNFLAPKGIKTLLRAMGRRENCSAAEVIRRAVLSRAGLENMPDEVMLAKLDKAYTNAEVADVLIDCQTVEYVKRELERQGRPVPAGDATAVMLSSRWYKDESYAVLRGLCDTIAKQPIMDKPRPLAMTKRDYLNLCRVLANTKIIDDDIL